MDDDDDDDDDVGWKEVNFWVVSCSLEDGLIRAVLTVHYHTKEPLRLVKIEV